MNEFQYQPGMAGYGQLAGQLAPQGFFGGLLGAPLGGLIGKGIGGLLGNSHLGGRIGNFAGGIGGPLLPFETDPMAAAYAQQQALQQAAQQDPLQAQLAALSIFGDMLNKQNRYRNMMSDPYGLVQRPMTQIGTLPASGAALPFNVDPFSAAYAQQQGQLAPQGWFGNLIGNIAQPAGGAIGGLFGNQGLGNTISDVAGQIGRMLPFNVDPVSAAYAQQHALAQQIQAQQAQQGQLAPQGWFGNLIGNIAQPAGGAIGGLFGNQGLGNTIGGVAGQIGRMLPFNIDPVTAAYAQQQALQQAQLQQAQLQQLQQMQQAQMQQAQQQPNGYLPAYQQQAGPYSNQPTLH